MATTSPNADAPDSSLPPLVENGANAPSLFGRLKSIWDYRELMSNMMRRELKVKYKNSVLGFAWSLLNPLLYLAVFSVVFSLLLNSPVELYGMYLLSGLLVWNLFALGTGAATTSIVGNGPLVQKVWFPREILPIAAIGATFVNFCLQLVVLFVGLVVFWRPPAWGMLWLALPALLVTLLFATALGLLLAALNVYFRDVQHFLEIALLLWFWLTPIVFQYDFMGDAVAGRLGSDRWLMLNPLMAPITTLQRVIYNPMPTGDPATDPFFLMFRGTGWYAGNLAMAGAGSIVLLVIAIWTFGRLEANFGEEI